LNCETALSLAATYAAVGLSKALAVVAQKIAAVTNPKQILRMIPAY
jgi:hypothetical protein